MMKNCHITAEETAISGRVSPHQRKAGIDQTLKAGTYYSNGWGWCQAISQLSMGRKSKTVPIVMAEGDLATRQIAVWSSLNSRFQ